MFGKSKIGTIISIVALGLTLGALIMVAASPAAAVLSGDRNYTYQSVTGGVEITAYNGTDNSVVIPSTIDGFQVVSIGAWAFANNTGLTQVTIPDKVTTIGDDAFAGCTSLTRIEFKGNAPTIGDSWVSGTTGLTVYYGYGATGFSGGSWQGLNLVALCDLVMSANFGTTSAGGTFDQGSTVTISATAPTAATGERYVWSQWVGTGTGSYNGNEQTHIFTISADITEQAVWTKQYEVTFDTPVGGTTSPAGDNWYAAGSLPVQASPSSGYSFTSWSSGNNAQITFASPSSASTSVTIGGSGTITATFAQVPVGVTITSSPAGADYVLVDGNAITTPQTFDWSPGSSHTLTASASVAVSSNEQYAFASWTDAGARVHTITVPATSETVTANFAHQYLLTTGSNFGTVTPATGTWQNAGATVPITATAPASIAGERYSVFAWTGTGSGSYSGSSNPGSITMNGPITETANWAHQYQLTMVSPVGTVDPATGSWYAAGAKVTLTATHPTPIAGEQYTFTSWTGSGTGSYDGASNPATNAVTMNGPITETATWNHQYQLTMGANFGTVLPATGSWYAAGTIVSLTATHPTTVAGEQYPSVSWTGSGTGSYDGASNPATNAVTMNGPITETATWAHQYQLTMGANFGTVLPATGSWYAAGATVTLTATHPTTAAGEQYSFTSWSGTGTGSYDGASNPATNAVTMNGPITETAVWAHQYQVSFVVSPPGGGTVTPAGTAVWENAGPISIQATPSSGYAYSSWTSDTGQITFDTQSSSTVASIAGSGTITATFSELPVGVTITSSPTGTGLVLVDGNAIVTPKTFSWLPGETHTLEAVATATIGTGERNEFMSWSDNGARVHSFTVTAATVTVTASFAHQYLVTMATNGGTTTPAAGTHWYNACSRLTLGAVAPSAGTGSQYVWAGWTGAGTGSYTGTEGPANTVTVSGPITETASWTKQYLLTFASSPSVGGTTSPTGGVWADAGTLAIQATASTGYAFSSWGSSTGSITFNAQTASTTAVIGAAGTITATFALQPVGVTITSSPAGNGYVIVDGVATATPNTFSWLPGSSHTIEATANVTAATGERYSFTSWSDAGARLHSYTVTAAATVTASFAHQYLVTMSTSGGTTTPAFGAHWYDAGSPVTLDATAPTAGTGMRYVWNDWTGTGTGSYTGTTKVAGITVSGPITETANWTRQYQVSFAVTPAGGGSTTPAGTGLWYDAGSLAIQATSSTDYAFSSWSSGSSSITFNAVNYSTTAVINGPGTITANFVLALGITITSSPTGPGYVLVDGVPITTPANFKWDAGTVHSIQAVSTVSGISGERYVFNSWSDGGARTHDYTVTALTATVIASFDHHYLLTMQTGLGTTTPAVSVNGIWENAGSRISINATAPSVASANERYLWVGWAGTGSGNFSGIDSGPAVTIMMNGPITEIAGWSHQFQVSITTDYGTTVPAAGNTWFGDGSSIYLTANPPNASASERYVFNGWTGTGTGSYTGMANPVTSVISVSGPITEAASWIRLQVPDAPGGFTANSSDGLVNLNWTAPSNGGLAIDYYVVYQNGVRVSAVNGLNTTIHGLTNGQTYSFTVAAHNPIGNGPNSTAAVIKPMVGPSGLNLDIISPLAGSYHQESSVLLEWTVSDLSSSVVRTEVSQDGTNWSTVTGTNQLMDRLADGNDFLLVRATDAANNVVTRIVRIVVDTAPPALIITAPLPSAYIGSHTVTVTWSVIEQVSGLAKVEMSTDGTNWVEQTGNTGTLTVPDGPNEVWVRATDNAGNDVIVAVPFIVDTVAPTVLAHAPDGSAESTLVIVNVTFDEPMNRTSTTVTINAVAGTMMGTAAWEGYNLTFTPTEALNGMTTYYVSVKGTDLAGNPTWENWTFQTGALGKITGVLYGHDGKFLANTVVRLVSASSAARTEMGHFILDASTGVDSVRETTSDAKGAFAFYDVPIGNYTLEFTEAGYLKKSTTVAMTPATVAVGGVKVDPGMLISDPSNGFVLILGVGAVCAVMAGAILLLGRMRNKNRRHGVRKPEPGDKDPEKKEGERD